MRHVSKDFKAHPELKDCIKRAVLVWHRRAGKEKACWNFMISQAVRKVGTYYYFFPSFAQGRKVLWDFIDKDGYRVLDHLPKELVAGNANTTEMKIRLKNGSLIQIIGTNNIDSIVGTNPIGCVFSEYSLQDPTAWTLIRPILAENGGWAVFNFTPRGQNHGKELYDMAKDNKAWFCQMLTVEDTFREKDIPVITKQDIEAERKSGMSEDYIQQEFYCSFTLGIEGSYYAKYMQNARDEDRIGKVPYAKQSRVYTAWDIGYGDSTAIIFSLATKYILSTMSRTMGKDCPIMLKSWLISRIFMQSTSPPTILIHMPFLADYQPVKLVQNWVLNSSLCQPLSSQSKAVSKLYGAYSQGCGLITQSAVN
jgi:hypothetical protein